ncbi:MAG: ABC transporter ATP-binding protein [Spirochaetaceae bacterium]|jgi:branched-chain amino acid transport system ATP-binding protein|nr:ABC transporter ATP-binding protein [Spirochaetaceae bacterium]
MLVVKDLVVHYGSIMVLKGISFDVAKGELICLIGGNGAGKTTTLYSVSAIIKKSGGQVLLEGKDITQARADKIVEAGLVQVPEGRRVFANLTVRENLEMGAYVRRDAAGIKPDMETVFTIFPRLKERIRQAAGTLSGGEQQMLAMGRALMAAPRLLLLDEPSMGLAPMLVDEIFAVIKRIRQGGTTILLVEQNAYKALEIADRGFIMETGMITKSGRAADLMKDPAIVEAYLGG